MFGSLGGSEIIVLFVLALLLFGPRRLPEIGRTLGKALAEFRKATLEFRTSLEREVEIEKVKEAALGIESSVKESLPRGQVVDLLTDPEPPKPDGRADTGA